MAYQSALMLLLAVTINCHVAMSATFQLGADIDPPTTSESTTDAITTADVPDPLTKPESATAEEKTSIAGATGDPTTSDSTTAEETTSVATASVPTEMTNSSINLITSSKYDGFAKVKAVWAFQCASYGCVVKSQKVHYKQLDKDNCDLEQSHDLVDQSFEVEPTQRDHVMRKLNANSLVNVTVTAVTVSGQELKLMAQTRTAQSAPSGQPLIMGPIPVGDGMWMFIWSALKCGERNSDTINYEYVLRSGRQVWESSLVDGVESKSIGPLSIGEDYTFKVRAHSEYGYGEYNEMTGTF